VGAVAFGPTPPPSPIGESMFRYLLKSLALLGVSAVLGSLVIFMLLRTVGGDVANIIAGTKASPETVNALRESLGLNRPLWEQYFGWLGGFITGDFGTSYAAGYAIGSEIARRVEPTLALTMGTLVVSIPIALAIGTYAALNHRRVRGLVVDATAQVGIGLPPFFLALVLVLLFSLQLGWLPATGYVYFADDPIGHFRSLALPITALSIGVVANLSRFVRSAMIEQLGEDYIRMARAKGRTLRGAAVVHGVRNAAIPLVSVSAVQVATLVTGAVIVENVFVLPGLGRLLLTSVLGREVIVVQSLMLVILLFILVLNLFADVIYGILDPRIRGREVSGG